MNQLTKISPPPAARQALVLVEEATALLMKADEGLEGLFFYDETDGTRFPARDSLEASALVDALEAYRDRLMTVEMKRYSGRAA